MCKQYLCALLLVACVAAVLTSAQDYDDEGYGNQGGANNGGGGGGGPGNQNDNEGYQNNYNDDGYSMPNGYQQNVDPESSNSNPSGYAPSQGGGGGGGGSDADGDYEGDDNSAASAPHPTIVRVRRSTTDAAAPEVARAATGAQLAAEASAPKLRVKRHGKYYIGPVYTYVKTDKHANFKWGVKHKVGKKHYG